MKHIRLMTPDEGDEAWRITIEEQDGSSKSLPMFTRLKLWMPTTDVVKLLHSMHRGATITGPDDQRVFPGPPGGLPVLHPSQPSRR